MIRGVYGSDERGDLLGFHLVRKVNLTWQRKRQRQRWQSLLWWLQLECERESLYVMMNLCVRASVCCSGSGQLR